MEHNQDIISERVDPMPAPKPKVERRNPEPRKYCKHDGKLVPPNRTIDGAPGRSTDMMYIDPDRLFCTLRCAAKFGVAAWNKYKRNL